MKDLSASQIVGLLEQKSHTGIRLGAAWDLGKLQVVEALNPLKIALEKKPTSMLRSICAMP